MGGLQPLRLPPLPLGKLTHSPCRRKDLAQRALVVESNLFEPWQDKDEREFRCALGLTTLAAGCCVESKLFMPQASAGSGNFVEGLCSAAEAGMYAWQGNNAGAAAKPGHT